MPRRRSGPSDPVDFAYLDPPYNQHRYFTNYHVWETLIRWDAPDHYGIACKRADAKGADNRSRFNSRRTMPGALARGRRRAQGDRGRRVLQRRVLARAGRARRDVCLLAGTSSCSSSTPSATWAPRSGSTTSSGRKVGKVSHLRNVERLAVCGPRRAVLGALEACSRLSFDGRETAPSRSGGEEGLA